MAYLAEALGLVRLAEREGFRHVHAHFGTNSATVACLTHVLEWDGEAITTIEGLEANGELDDLQRAFIEYGAVQCGSCTPGVIMSAKAVVNAYPEPSEEQINAGMAGVLCRCTGHIKVKEAIRHVADRLELHRELVVLECAAESSFELVAALLRGADPAIEEFELPAAGALRAR